MIATDRLRSDEPLWRLLADCEDALIAARLPSGLACLERFLWDREPSPELHAILTQVARIARTTKNTSAAVVEIDKLIQEVHP